MFTGEEEKKKKQGQGESHKQEEEEEEEAGLSSQRGGNATGPDQSLSDSSF